VGRSYTYKEILRKGHRWVLKADRPIAGAEHLLWLKDVDSEMRELLREKGEEDRT